MKKIKMFCESCQAVVPVEDEDGPCPECGCRDLTEPEDEGVGPYELFDSPCSPVDTVGGI